MEPSVKRMLLIRNEFDFNLDLTSNPEDAEKRIVTLRKFFSAWRKKTRIKREKAEIARLKVAQREKLENLMKALKKYKKENDETTQDKPVIISSPPAVSNYKNRFEAQKVVIEKLSGKLEEKNRLIQELKSGIYTKDNIKEIEEKKNEIREIFAQCSVKIRCKIPPPVDYNEKFMVSTQKAPKIVREMEERALERAQRREMILERKRVIEEQRKIFVAEALERKRAQDEEETRKNLQTIKERRQKDLEQQKIRQANKTAFLEKLSKATTFHNKKLIKWSFHKLFNNYKENRIKYFKSVIYHKKKILRKSLDKWKNFIEGKYAWKYQVADAYFAKIILTKTFKILAEARIEGIRSMQVAEDFYDFTLEKNVFINWHRYTCIQYVKRDRQLKIAKQHYSRKLLFHYFYQWRSLPAVLQLEKAKEEKKRKWRQKVWEILPDYQPPDF